LLKCFACIIAKAISGPAAPIRQNVVLLENAHMGGKVVLSA
jgi:hypothetical protein